MKFSLYIAGLAFIIVSCSTTRNFSSIMEDDIYYVPGKKALAIREVENLTGHDIGTEQPVDPTVLAGEISRSAGSSTPPATFSSSNNTKINARSGQLEQVNIQSLTREAEEKLANNEEIDMTLYENTGYWIGGYRGPASDLAEIQRIIGMSIQITDVTGGFRPIRISIYILPCFSVLIRNISGPSYGTIPASTVGLSTLLSTTVSTGV